MAAPTTNQIQDLRQEAQRLCTLLQQVENNSTLSVLSAVQAQIKTSTAALLQYTGYSNPSTGTVAAVASGTGLVVPVTGTYVTTATPTVVNGVVTAIVLS